MRLDLGRSSSKYHTEHWVTAGHLLWSITTVEILDQYRPVLIFLDWLGQEPSIWMFLKCEFSRMGIFTLLAYFLLLKASSDFGSNCGWTKSSETSVFNVRMAYKCLFRCFDHRGERCCLDTVTWKNSSYLKKISVNCTVVLMYTVCYSPHWPGRQMWFSVICNVRPWRQRAPPMCVDLHCSFMSAHRGFKMFMLQVLRWIVCIRACLLSPCRWMVE